MKPATNERTRMYERCRGRPKAPPGPQRALATCPVSQQQRPQGTQVRCDKLAVQLQLLQWRQEDGG